MPTVPKWAATRASRPTAAFTLCLLLACLPLLALPGGVARIGQVQDRVRTRTLAFVGDVMLGRGVAQALNGAWHDAFEEVRSTLTAADVALANLESPLTNKFRSGGQYDLRAEPDAVVALSWAGFDIVSLANNHALDAGRQGLEETVAHLDGVGISAVGVQNGGGLTRAGARREGLPPFTILAFDDSVVALDLRSASRAVASAAQRGNPVIVSIHWGGEYQATPGPRQRAVAAALSRAGATVIVGHGPHVLQRVEWIGDTLVAFSLGNFLFDQPYPVDCRWGAILLVDMVEGEVAAVRAVPTVTRRGRTRFASGEEARAILARLDITGQES